MCGLFKEFSQFPQSYIHLAQYMYMIYMEHISRTNHFFVEYLQYQSVPITTDNLHELTILLGAGFFKDFLFWSVYPF